MCTSHLSLCLTLDIEVFCLSSFKKNGCKDCIFFLQYLMWPIKRTEIADSNCTEIICR